MVDLKAYLAQASEDPVFKLVEARNRWKCLECDETVLEIRQIFPAIPHATIWILDLLLCALPHSNETWQGADMSREISVFRFHLEGRSQMSQWCERSFDLAHGL